MSLNSEGVFEAVKAGRADVLSSLLERGVDPDSTRVDISALMFAVLERRADCARVLINAGADPDQPNEMGWTPMLEAARTGQDDLLSFLIEHGASLTTVDRRGETASHAVVRGRRGDSKEEAAAIAATLALLAQRGVSLFLANRKGLTPLMLAVDLNRMGAVSALVALGADPDQARPGQPSARDRASNSPDMLALFGPPKSAVLPPVPVVVKTSAPVVNVIPASQEQASPPGLTRITKRSHR